MPAPGKMPRDKRASKQAAKAKLTTASAATPAPPPAWPAFRPSLPLADLEPEPLLDAKVFLLRNFWPRSLCRDYVSFLRTLSLTTTPGKPKRGDAVRVNDRFQIDDPAFARRLWVDTGLKDALLAEEWRHNW